MFNESTVRALHSSRLHCENVMYVKLVESVCVVAQVLCLGRRDEADQLMCYSCQCSWS
jgi:hypothetical protein